MLSGSSSAESFSHGRISRTLSLAAQIIRRTAFVQMRVAVRDEMAAKGVNPVARRAHETFFFALVLAVDRAGVLGHVRRLEGFVVVENRRVKTAVIILVGLDEKTVRKHPPAVAQHQAEKIIRLVGAALQGLESRLQIAPPGRSKKSATRAAAENMSAAKFIFN